MKHLKKAAVAVVGGGVIGASVAYHLAINGVRNVVVLDRGSMPGAGSTSRATGGFRAQFGTAINVRLSIASREMLLRFPDDIGADPEYSPVGYLWLASSDAQLASLLAAQRSQHAEGLREAVMINPGEAASINPAVSLDGVIGGAFCPTDGYIRPMAILRGYLGAAKWLGARVQWRTDVVGMSCNANGRIEKLRTSRGEMAVDAVVNAAGPWAARLAAMAGASLPVVPLRRQVAVSRPPDVLPETTPMTIFVDDGFHFRVRDGRVMLVWPTPGAPGDPFDVSVEPEWIEAVTAKARQRVPALRDAVIKRNSCYAGLYEMSPDRHAIVGVSAECENLFFVNGSSGHGVMHAPALGRAIGEVICGFPPTLDVSELSPLRFAEGRAIEAAELL
ncbi:MAG: FAD-binding oxidoreductase [Gemmatimonadaceae bacterium]|nr:FAD-binding oxidoreductase [Gemmatimonadaceae bacterium]